MNNCIKFIDDSVLAFFSLPGNTIHLLDVSVKSRYLKVRFPQHSSLPLTLLLQINGLSFKLNSHRFLFSKGRRCKMQGLLQLSYLFDVYLIFSL